MKLIQTLFSVDGRIDRKTYWHVVIAAPIITIAFCMSAIFVIVHYTTEHSFLSNALPTIAGATVAACIYSVIAVSIKRLHDRDHSGWALLVLLIPIVGLLWCLTQFVLPGTNGRNQFGDNFLGQNLSTIAINKSTSANNERQGKRAGDLVTEISLLRSIEALSRLEVGRVVVVSETADIFFGYLRRTSAEFLGLTLEALACFKALSSTEIPLGLRAVFLARLIRRPGSILSRPKWAFHSHFGSMWLSVMVAIVAGELLNFAMFSGLCVIVILKMLGPQATTDDIRWFYFLFMSLAACAWTTLRAQSWLLDYERASRSSTFWLWIFPTLVSSTLHGGLRSIDLRRVAPYLWKAAVFCGFIGVLGAVALFLLPDEFLSGLRTAAGFPLEARTEGAEGKPCPEVGPSLDIALANYKSAVYTRFSSPSEDAFSNIRKQLTVDVDSISEKNHDQCGKYIDGRWILVQNQVIDFYFDLDPELIPLPKVPVSSSEAAAIGQRVKIALAAIPPTVPPAGLGFGLYTDLLIFERRFEASNLVSEEERAIDDVTKLRRLGVLLESTNFPEYKAKSEASTEIRTNALTTKLVLADMGGKLETLKSAKAVLDKTGTRPLLVLVCVVSPILAFFAVLVRQWSRARERNWLRRIANERDFNGLCNLICESSNSEWARRRILRKLSEQEGLKPSHIETLEAVAEQLRSSTLSADRDIAIEVAEVARVLDNRVRHGATGNS